MRYQSSMGTFASMAWVLCLLMVGVQAHSSAPCMNEDRTLNVGFYADFGPVSYSADRDENSPGFHQHRGYEADLLDALEAMEHPKLSFSRQGIAVWDGIWLLPAGPRYDIVGGGITILDSRTRDASGKTAIVFTSGHIKFRQSLLIHTEDAQRIARHRDLTGADRVGVFPGTTGEARFLVLTGLADGDGVLAAGTQVDTPAGTVVADGSMRYVINAAGASPELTDRQTLRPASDTLPTVVYFAEDEALIEALVHGSIDAIAQGEVGNRVEGMLHGDLLSVTALDDLSETGGFALSVEDAELAACLDRNIEWLTDGGRIGYQEWFNDPTVFLQRARQPIVEDD